jgi:dTMP kinase
VEARGKLITFEGPDGAGKTTQIQLTEGFLEEQGYPVVRIREPGGTRLSEAIRQLLLDPSYKEMSAAAEALLYAAARAQLIDEVILPQEGIHSTSSIALRASSRKPSIEANHCSVAL